MEHGLESPLTAIKYNYLNNIPSDPIMANFPDEVANPTSESKPPLESPKINGDARDVSECVQSDPFDDTHSSESDVLVIDERIPKQKKKGRRRVNKKGRDNDNKVADLSETEAHIAPYASNQDLMNHYENKLNICVDDYNQALGRNTSTVQPSEVPSKAPQECVLIESKNTEKNTLSEVCDSVNVCNSVKDSEHNSNYENLTPNSVSNNNLELLTHSNPFFHESLFELSQLHHSSNCEAVADVPTLKNHQTVKPVKPKPKLKEYAQYLGLQPAVQFKCPKCGKSGFESLVILQEHFLNCTAIHSVEKSTEGENISGFKLTRKVFLCSACGTYYENWNLYIHMLEHHKRYICLYCLGMFSVLEDLCQHIELRHNLEPGVKHSLEEFYNTYNEPCYIICCECNQQFNEGDNFFYHNCVSSKLKNKKVKQVIAPENHVTGDFGALLIDADKDNQSTKTQECEYQKPPTFPLGHTDDRFSNDIPYDSTSKGTEGDNNDKQSSDDMDASNNSDSDSYKSNDNLNIKSYEDRSSDNLDGIKSDDNTPNNIENKKNIGENDSLDSFTAHQVNEENSANRDTMNTDFKKEEISSESVETRKVPKLSLKLPKVNIYQHPTEDSDDSDKPNAEVDNIESEPENENPAEKHRSDPEEELESELHNGVDEKTIEEEQSKSVDSQYAVAGSDVTVVEIELDQPLDKMDITILLQKCLRATVSTCIYCNHARRIAVNGKQLALHAMAEHRYSAINKSITEEELIPESFNIRIKECLEYLETVYFNLDSGVSEEAVTFSHVFECFQCHYSTTVHKELYLHNRKFHSKNLLLCIMCKSNFYSYSELICHLCPGLYVLDCDVHFRCCMCVSDDLPSSFRLMVHLRKRHNVCDVCLEMCHSQYKLSNHVWKHKLHHFCYRCGIAYRNKPDITRHLFWKHGTESVLCKKCLQKKWPHVYHFCVPPSSFTCEECNLAFSKAASLKVHKRLHTDERKHQCTWQDCSEAFISKKLMLKHLKWHTDPPEEIIVEEEVKDEPVEIDESENVDNIVNKTEGVTEDDPTKAPKPKVDVYNLPELNLSESDSSDSENETEKVKKGHSIVGDEDQPIQEVPAINDSTVETPEETMVSAPLNTTVDVSQTVTEASEIEMEAPVQDTSSAVMQDIWDNFKNYQASKEKMDHMLIGEPEFKVDKPYVPDIPIPVVEEGISCQLALRDHDYCIDPEKVQPPLDAIVEIKPSLESTESVDHDYCFQKEGDENSLCKPTPVLPSAALAVETTSQETPNRKRTNSSSSSSSDSSDSSCACGSSCSCSDSSSGSSSSSSNSSNSDSSTEEGRKKQQQRRLKRRERIKGVKKKESLTAIEESQKEPSPEKQPQVVASEMPILESDLETTESDTDEEFYDREPHKFAKKILDEKRAQLIAEMGPHVVPNGSFIESTSRPPTPPEGTIEAETGPKKKKKSKKRKKRKSDKRALNERSYSATIISSETIVPPPPPSVPYYQQFHQIESQASSTVAPITLSISRYSPVTAPQTPPLFDSTVDTPSVTLQESTASDSSVRASKRRRVPNKFYGYSSDEESDNKPSHLKRPKLEVNRTIPAPPSPMMVPPITIKTVPSTPIITSPRKPTVEPITLRLPKAQRVERQRRRPPIPPIRLAAPRRPVLPAREDSATESNDSDMDDDISQRTLQGATEQPKLQQPQLYCYCRCPYDEVSEMIGCDSNDCQIEWFHFECVGIMVPPKGQWFCPDCRKKKQQRLAT